jgi:hypothetical protein
MLLCIGLFVLSMLRYQDFAARYPEKNTAWEWTPAEMELIFSRVGLSFDWWLQSNFISSILFAVLIGGIGIFLFFRKGHDWFGLYLAAAFVMFGTLSNNTTGILSTFYPAWEPFLDPLGVLAWVGIFFVFYLFPNGSFVPRWTRWAGVLIVLSFGFNQIAYGGGTPPPFLLLPMMLLIALGPVSQVYRYFMAPNPIERQQTKWVMLAMIVVIVILLTGMLPLFSPGVIEPNSSLAPGMALLTSLYGLIMGLIPISITFAILRYRLWDVDVLIRRTLVYTLLSGLLGLVYFGGVAIVQGIMTADSVGYNGGPQSAVSGPPSAVVIVATTLAIYALFNPLRRRLQETIDRRFYRQKYDAEKALADFAAAARSEANLPALTHSLLNVVQDTVQPEEVKLWLKPTKS